MNRFNTKNLTVNWPLLINIIGLMVSAVFQSRAFLVGFLAAICFTWMLKKTMGYRDKIKNQIILVFYFITVVFLLSYCFKQGSSAGRVLIYKVSWQMLKDHWVFGTGLATFGHDYLNYQASYFANGRYTTQELLLADNTKHAFNDYLQWVIETGLSGFVLFVAALLLLVWLGRRAVNIHSDYPDFLIIAISLLTTTLTAALFTHVFEAVYFQLIFTVSVGILISYSFKLQRKQVILLLLILPVTIAGLNYYQILVNYPDYKKINEAKALYDAGFIKAGLQNCEQVYPKMRHNALFLSLYADILTTSGNNSKALSVLKELVNQDNSYFFHIRLAACYQEVRDFKDAEKEYTLAVNMVPNRFISRYKLFRFYCKTDDKEKAVNAAYQILHLPVKIPSLEITAIKRSVQAGLAGLDWKL